MYLFKITPNKVVILRDLLRGHYQLSTCLPVGIEIVPPEALVYNLRLRLSGAVTYEGLHWVTIRLRTFQTGDCTIAHNSPVF